MLIHQAPRDQNRNRSFRPEAPSNPAAPTKETVPSRSASQSRALPSHPNRIPIASQVVGIDEGLPGHGEILFVAGVPDVRKFVFVLRGSVGEHEVLSESEIRSLARYAADSPVV